MRDTLTTATTRHPHTTREPSRARVRWRRLTRAHAWPVPVLHGDHVGELDGQPIAYLTRRVDGWWTAWTLRADGWATRYASRDLRKARRIVEDQAH